MSMLAWPRLRLRPWLPRRLLPHVRRIPDRARHYRRHQWDSDARLQRERHQRPALWVQFHRGRPAGRRQVSAVRHRSAPGRQRGDAPVGGHHQHERH